MIRLVSNNVGPISTPAPLDDLLHLLSVQIRKLQDSPTDTLRLSIKRTFDKVVERMG